MTDTKTFTIAGTSTKDGVNTFRFATGKANVRASVLKRNGHTDIALQDLPSAMTKEEAVEFLEGAGITAVVPKSGRKAAVEQIAAKEAEAKKAATNEARRKARAAAKEAKADTIDVDDGSAESLINAMPDAEQIETTDLPAPLAQEEEIASLAAE